MQLVVRSKQITHHPVFRFSVGIFCYLGHGEVWHEGCVSPVLPLLFFQTSWLPSLSSCFSKFCSPNAKYFHSMHIDELYSMCTVNPILLCHIRPYCTCAHTVSIVNVQRVWCLFKPVCSCVQHFIAHARVFLHDQFLTAVCLPPATLLSTGGQFSVKGIAFWTPVEDSAGPEMFEKLDRGVCSSVCPATCFEQKINNIGKKIDFRPRFSSWAAGTTRVSLRPHPTLPP